MNPRDLIVKEILDFYADNFNEFPLIPTEHRECEGSCILIGPGSNKSGIGYYQYSITLDQTVKSSDTGQILQLQNIFDNHLKDKMSLFWIRESQGLHNARIIAHILTMNNDEREIMAFVKRPS